MNGNDTTAVFLGSLLGAAGGAMIGRFVGRHAATIAGAVAGGVAGYFIMRPPAALSLEPQEARANPEEE